MHVSNYYNLNADKIIFLRNNSIIIESVKFRGCLYRKTDVLVNHKTVQITYEIFQYLT